MRILPRPAIRVGKEEGANFDLLSGRSAYAHERPSADTSISNLSAVILRPEGSVAGVRSLLRVAVGPAYDLPDGICQNRDPASKCAWQSANTSPT